MDPLSSARTVEEVAAAVRGEARAAAAADGATFVLREGDFVYYIDEDSISPLWKGCRFPIDACISGWSMVNQRATFVADIYRDPRIPHAAYRPTYVRSLLMTPVRDRAAIGVYWARERLADAAVETRLAWLARRVAAALDRVPRAA